MKRVINLVSFDLRTYMFDLEQMNKKIEGNIRYFGVPYHDNDMTMYRFFRCAYPSQFQSVKFLDMGKCVKSDAGSPEDYYTGAGRLFFRDACYITRNLLCKDAEKETRRVLSEIDEWLEPDALTLIDLPQITGDDRTTSFSKDVIQHMTMRYNCIVINYASYFEKEYQTEGIKAADLNVPYIHWKGIRNVKAKNLLEQAQYDEKMYQNHIVELINNRGQL